MDGREALAIAYGEWIDKNGWTREEVAAKGGPSTATTSMIRNTRDPISRQTLGKIDTVMGWEKGTASRVLNGEEPPSGSYLMTFSQPSVGLTEADDTELTREMLRRMQVLKQRLSTVQSKLFELEPLAQVELDRQIARQDWRVRNLDKPQFAHLSHEWNYLAYAADEEGWSAEHRERYRALCWEIDGQIWLEDAGLTQADLALAADSGHEKLDDVLRAQPYGQHTAGEENQDDGSWE